MSIVGRFASLAVVTAMAAAASWMAGVHDVRAAGPAELDGNLSGYGSSAAGHYVATGRTFTGTRLPSTPQPFAICRALATDAPCMTGSAPALAGTLLWGKVKVVATSNQNDDPKLAPATFLCRCVQ